MSRAEVIFQPGYILSDGRYEIIEELGRGGMGVVYKGKDRSLEIEVALKFQYSDATSEEKALFRKEAITMSKLAGHSNIISIFYVHHCLVKTEYGNEPTNYIACEYIQGKTAESLVKNKNKNKEEIIKCIEVAAAVCNGLSHAHEHNSQIIHRDIKPSNILIGVNNIVKVSDFGLAKPLGEPSGKITARFYGTPPYMAPEQFTTDNIPNIKIDIWQLGVTLYEIFTGDLPYPKVSMNNVPKEAPSFSLHDKNKIIPSRISDCIMSMLSVEPEKRPRDCKEIQETLEREIESLDPNKKKITKIWELPQFKSIRHAFKVKIDSGIQKLIAPDKGRNLIIPSGKMRTWYATLLIRPADRFDSSFLLADRFSPIFFAEYHGEKMEAVSDWEKEPNLIAQPLNINECCSGLPIRWYEEGERGKKWDKDKDLFISRVDDDDFIRFFALKNIKYARFKDPNPNIIKETYATDKKRNDWERDVGWDLETILQKTEKAMSQEIETEILIPIYKKSAQVGSGIDIIGIANFEWEKKFTNAQIFNIGTFLAKEIQDNNCFDLNYFACCVLPNVTITNNQEADNEK